MKKQLFSLTCTFFTLGAIFMASAQDKPAAGPANPPSVVPLQDPLHLSKDQQVPYREIIKRYATLMGELRRSILTPEEKKQKQLVLLSQREAEIKATLSPEQFEVFQKLEAERQARQVNMRKPPLKMQ